MTRIREEEDLYRHYDVGPMTKESQCCSCVTGLTSSHGLHIQAAARDAATDYMLTLTGSG